jgi:hypothetical protein
LRHSEASRIASHATQAQYALSRPNGETIHVDHGAGRNIFGFSGV